MDIVFVVTRSIVYTVFGDVMFWNQKYKDAYYIEKGHMGHQDQDGEKVGQIPA